MKQAFLFFLIAAFLPGHSLSDDFIFSGQGTGWALTGNEGQLGLRYIPQMRITDLFNKGEIDTEISIKTEVTDKAELGLYRAWLRYAKPKYEMRLGLQRINFGPAKIFRSLRWFDQIDIRDPLQLTSGVYGLLARYFFLNNCNVWIWTLYGNHEPRGLEIVKTSKSRAELGGRYQLPVPGGEMGFSFHRRFIDRADWKNKMNSSLTKGLHNRYGVDGVWDIGIGLWAEAVAGEIKINEKESLWKKFLTLGCDYTLPIGPGLYVIAEHFISSSGPELDINDEVYKVSAVSADFSISLADSINLISFYDWDQKKIYPYLGWNRTYDRWLFNLSIFSSADNGETLYTGEGALVLITYNH